MHRRRFILFCVLCFGGPVLLCAQIGPYPYPQPPHQAFTPYQSTPYQPNPSNPLSQPQQQQQFQSQPQFQSRPQQQFQTQQQFQSRPQQQFQTQQQFQFQPQQQFQTQPPRQQPPSPPYAQAGVTLQPGTLIRMTRHQQETPPAGTPTAPVPTNVPPANIPGAPAPTGSDEELVQLNFPNEIDLEVLVEYISELLGLKIIYDETVANKKIRLRTTGDIPINSLMQVLQSALKMKELTIVEGEVPGWKRIVPVAQLGRLAPQGDAQQVLKDKGGATPVMQIFKLEHADVTQVQQLIQPFLTTPGGMSTPVKESNVLIIADYAVNVLRAGELIETLDVPKPTIQTEFLEVRNIDATALARQITTLLQSRSQVSGQAATAQRINITSDPRTNQLILIGTAEEITATKQLIEYLDVPTTLTTELYSFQYVDARDIDSLIRSMLDPLQEKQSYRSVINRNDNSLVVSTTKDIHEQIAALGKRLNIPTKQKQSPIRFFKLNNTTVDEVMTTLNALRQGSAFAPQQRERDALRRTLPGSQETSNHIGGAIQLPLRPNEPLPQLTPDVSPTDAAATPVLSPAEATLGTGSQNVGPMSMMNALLDTDVRITADTKTNTIIVIAEPQVQEHYETLIKFLDRRSPQVLIEAKIVTIDTSNEFMLGVEVGGGDRTGIKKLFGFSSFGLSSVDPVTGALALIPGVGFNGTLVDPDTADVIVRALSLNSRAKVVASPRVLVNDNEEGRLQSVLSIPYMSLNSSQVVQSTSLGGNQDAGTTVVVTPHIGDGEQLQLEFAVEFSNFGSSSGNNLPPPRHVDQVSSVVTIPDGYTVIVGGLNRQNLETATQGIPILEKIPIIKLLASQQSKKNSSTSLFVFLKPIILRDDKFNDLKYLSDGDVRSAQIKTDLPQSCPIVMQ